MRIASRLARLLAVMAIALTLGCASAYRDYGECRVDCRYCVPSPLPYVHYAGCVCHTCAASKYLASDVPLVPEPVAPHDDAE